MKILFLANHLNVGGISSYLFTLGSGLKERGHRVYLASSGGELEEKFLRAGIHLIKVPLDTKSEVSPKIFISFWKLRKAASDINIDLIHSHSRTTQVLGCRLGRALGRPHIFTCHGFFKAKLPRRIFGCWGQRVIAISEQVKEHLRADFKLSENKIRVIHNGIDTRKFGDFSGRESLRGSLGVIPGGFLIGIIARLSDVKGHLYLIRAMPEILKKFAGTKLVIIGRGKTEESLLKETGGLGLADKIIFVPEAKDTREWLCAMDVFAMPSLQEGLGLALMEAMAQGLAVAGSAVGGIKTLVQDKITGLLVPAQDPQALAQAIITLLGDADLRRNLGRKASEFINANFSAKDMVEKTENLYRELLKQELA